MPPEQVLFGFRGRLPEVRRCFEGSDGGIVHLSWRVDESGQVRDTSVQKSTLDTPAVERCLSDVVRDLHFGERALVANASWTFVHGVADPSALERAGQMNERRTQRRNGGVVVDPSSPGRLPIDQIENVAEHGFRLYAFCMREGLNRDISLSGRVLLRFTIDPAGQVQGVRDAGSDLADVEVIDCVAEAFYAMRFPEPEGGSVHLKYSLLLNGSD
jgi:hypothetical protein